MQINKQDVLRLVHADNVNDMYEQLTRNNPKRRYSDADVYLEMYNKLSSGHILVDGEWVPNTWRELCYEASLPSSPALALFKQLLVDANQCVSPYERTEFWRKAYPRIQKELDAEKPLGIKLGPLKFDTNLYQSKWTPMAEQMYKWMHDATPYHYHDQFVKYTPEPQVPQYSRHNDVLFVGGSLDGERYDIEVYKHEFRFADADGVAANTYKLQLISVSPMDDTIYLVVDHLISEHELLLRLVAGYIPQTDME